MAGMAANGVTPDVGEQIYDKLKAFADFGFPESHAYSFAYLVYASSWLKVHHPAAFFAGLLAAQPMGFYSPQSLVADARRHGVTVLRPDVQASAPKAVLERIAAGNGAAMATGPPPTSDVLPGLEVGARRSHARRADGPGRRCGASGRTWRRRSSRSGPRARRSPGLRDLVRRVRLTTPQVEALATAGALECFGVDRRAGLWAAGALAQEGPDTLPGVAVGVDAPTLPGMSQVEEAMADVWATGVSVDSYPTQYVRDGLVASGRAHGGRGDAPRAGAQGRRRRGGHAPAAARDGAGRDLPLARGRDRAAQRHLLRGAVAPVPRRWRAAPRRMVVRGRLERADGATNLMAEHLAPLSLRMPTSSRDYR